MHTLPFLIWDVLNESSAWPWSKRQGAMGTSCTGRVFVLRMNFFCTESNPSLEWTAQGGDRIPTTGLFYDKSSWRARMAGPSPNPTSSPLMASREDQIFGCPCALHQCVSFYGSALRLVWSQAPMQWSCSLLQCILASSELRESV